MGGHAADPTSPFNGWVREAYAEFTGGEFLDFLATVTLLNNLVTATSVKLTPGFAHKKAIRTFLNRLTNHGYHDLSVWIFWNQFLCTKYSKMSSGFTKNNQKVIHF
jgi:hypothetical protein